MTQTTDIDIRELKDLIQSLDRKMEAGFANVDRKMEAGFADVDRKFVEIDRKMELGFANVDLKLSKLEGRIDTIEAKFDERTKGFGLRLDGKELAQRNISAGLTVAIVGGLLLTLSKYLFFGALP
jgi:hypothetical protein